MKNPPTSRTAFCFSFVIHRSAFIVFFFVAALLSPRAVEAGNTVRATREMNSGRRFNLTFPTLGGFQFWGDERVYCGWRIQRNALTRHCRLIDPWHIRRAWGTYRECEAAFRSLVDTTKVRPRSDECVVLLHGLFRTRRSFRRLERHLAEQGYEVVGFEYPSTQAAIEKQAEQLSRFIERLEGAREIHFVTHSLGGLVVRCYLRDHHDERIGRMVMIAPPNRGSHISDKMGNWLWFRSLAGPAGRQLLKGPTSVYPSLPEPSCEFGVIAGGRGSPRGYSPLLPGDDDGVVMVQETHLGRMRDFLLVPALHTFIMNDERVMGAVAQFLRTGRFGGA